jgi:hypothetical protein
MASMMISSGDNVDNHLLLLSELRTEFIEATATKLFLEKCHQSGASNDENWFPDSNNNNAMDIPSTLSDEELKVMMEYMNQLEQAHNVEKIKADASASEQQEIARLQKVCGTSILRTHVNTAIE